MQAFELHGFTGSCKRLKNKKLKTLKKVEL